MTTVTVRVPIALRKRGGRKRIVAPDGTETHAQGPPGHVSTLAKALARAHRWQAMLESGDYASIAELAVAEKINPSYVARMLRLTLLAPDVVEAILGGLDHQAEALEQLSRQIDWRAQAQRFRERPR